MTRRINFLDRAHVEGVAHLSCGMVLGVSRIWRKEVFNDIGGFKRNTFIFEDYEFSVAAWKKGKSFQKSGLQLYYYRIHPKQLTHARKLPSNY